jgi:hypothetical protein
MRLPVLTNQQRTAATIIGTCFTAGFCIGILVTLVRG